MYSFSVFTSAVSKGEWLDSYSGRFSPGGKGLRCPLLRRLGGHQKRSLLTPSRLKLLTVVGN